MPSIASWEPTPISSPIIICLNDAAFARRPSSNALTRPSSRPTPPPAPPNTRTPTGAILRLTSPEAIALDLAAKHSITPADATSSAAHTLPQMEGHQYRAAGKAHWGGPDPSGGTWSTSTGATSRGPITSSRTVETICCPVAAMAAAPPHFLTAVRNAIRAPDCFEAFDQRMRGQHVGIPRTSSAMGHA